MQHDRLLTGDQVRNHDNLAARKFKRIMMGVRIVWLDLPKSRNFVVHARFSGVTQGVVILDVVLERQLGTGEEADGHIGFSDGGKATGNCFREIRHHQVVAKFYSP